MRKLSLITAAAILLGIAAGCSSPAEEPQAKAMDPAKMQEQGISEGVAPGSGGTQDPGQAAAPPASPSASQGDL